MNKQKKVITQTDRNTIVVSNFFKYLKEKGISNTQYAKDNFIDKSLLTQWKNGTTRMTMEHVYNASKYFGVTVNDLMYDDNEKKNIEILEDTSYSPVQAVRHEKVKKYNFEDAYETLIFGFLFMIVFAIFAFFIRKHEVTSVICMCLGIVMHIFISRHILIEKKVFVINYLDDIYYKIDNPKNEKRVYRFIVCTLLSIFTLLNIFIILNKFRLLEYSIISLALFAVFLFGNILFLFFLAFQLISNPKELKDELYSYEIEVYISAIILLLLSFSFFLVFILLSIVGDYLIWPILISSILNVILSFINFVIIQEKYQNFYLVYNEGGEKEHKLFKK